MNSEKQQSLKKSLSPMTIWALAFGCIIGWGSFINPGKKFLPNSGVAGTAIAMVLGALVMIIIAFSYAYMIRKYPKAGGEFTFAKECFGKIPAYICGWFLVAAYLTNVPMNSTAIPLIFEGLFGEGCLDWWGISYNVAGSSVTLGGIIISCTILVLFAILNIIGVEKAGFVQKVLAVLLVGSAVTLCVSGIIFGINNGVNFKPIWGFDLSALKESGSYNPDMAKTNILSSILATFAIAPWAFVGFDTIPQAAEEMNFSHKKVIFIMIIAILFGCFVYISNNTVCAIALENWPEESANGKWVVLLAAEKFLGTFGKVLVGVGVLCAVLSGMMGFYLSSSRLLYSMSKDNYLPNIFGKIDAKYGTPKNAIIFCMIISLSGPFLGREALGWFVDMSAIGASIGFLFTSMSTLSIINRDKDGSKLLKIFAIMGVIFSFVFIVLQLIPIPGLDGVHFCWQSYIMLLVWIVLGLVFYIKQKNKLK